MLVADGVIKNFKEINYNIGILSVVSKGGNLNPDGVS